MIQFVTNFADQAVLLPLAIGIGLILLFSHWRRAAQAWTIGIGGTYLTMLVLKLCFIACGHLLLGHIVSPSGHVAAAAAVYGGLFALFARAVTGHSRWTLPTALGIATMIGLTRLSLGAHTVSEVLVGATIGICGAVVSTTLIGPPPRELRIRWLAGLAFAILLLCHGFRMPAEAAIHEVAANLWPLTACHTHKV
jgi:membrane-associated phospholipid phosphatase